MSFWLDWWLLLGFGILDVGIAKSIARIFKLNEYWTEWVKRILYLGSLAIFFALSIGLLCGFTMGKGLYPGNEVQIGPAGLAKINDWFFGILRWFYSGYYSQHPEATSTDFMYSSGQIWLRDSLKLEFYDLEGLAQKPGYLFGGIIILCAYPWLLHAGFQLGDMLWGSKPGKKGMYRMIWGFMMIISLILVPVLMGFSLQNTILPVWAWLIILDMGVFLVFYGNFVLVIKKKEGKVEKS